MKNLIYNWGNIGTLRPVEVSAMFEPLVCSINFRIRSRFSSRCGRPWTSAKGNTVNLTAVQKMRQLIEQLRSLIECADQLPQSPERDAILKDLVHYRDRLNAIVTRTLN